MYRNLQEFVQRLEREGELVRVKTPVSSRFEIAEITDRMAKSEGGGKALLFENTDGDFPVLTNMMGSSRRIAMALGVERLEQIGERIDALLKDVLSPKGSMWEKMQMLPVSGSKVLTIGNVTKAPPSDSHECNIGRRSRSTSSPLITTS